MKMAVDYLSYTDSGSITLNLFGKPPSAQEAAASAADDEAGQMESTTQITGMTGAGMTMMGTTLASPTRLTKAGRGSRPKKAASQQEQQQVLEMPPAVLIGLQRQVQRGE